MTSRTMVRFSPTHWDMRDCNRSPRNVMLMGNTGNDNACYIIHVYMYVKTHIFYVHTWTNPKTMFD